MWRVVPACAVSVIRFGCGFVAVLAEDSCHGAQIEVLGFGGKPRCVHLLRNRSATQSQHTRLCFVRPVPRFHALFHPAAAEGHRPATAVQG